jgi:hypothetical protein
MFYTSVILLIRVSWLVHSTLYWKLLLCIFFIYNQQREWRKLHNEELNDLTQYCAGGKIETIEMGRECGAYGGG